MTNDEIRIKVAEACGWKIKNTAHYNPPCKLWEHAEWGVGVEGEDLPNYLEDLNACASFEAALTECERRAYFFNLFGSQRLEDGDLWKAVAATARQRCLAFLKTKGILP